MIIETREQWHAGCGSTPHSPLTNRNTEDAMATITTPNGIELRVIAAQNGVPVVNVYHLKTSGAVTLANLEAAAETYADWYETLGRGYFHSSYVLQSIVATDISVSNGMQYTWSEFSTPAGAITSAPAAANAAAVISWRTPFIGRSYRGRTYIGGLANAELVDAQHLQSSTASGMAVDWGVLQDAWTTAGLVLSVLSKVAAGVLRIHGILTEVTAIVVDTKVDSQRRRTAN